MGFDSVPDASEIVVQKNSSVQVHKHIFFGFTEALIVGVRLTSPSASVPGLALRGCGCGKGTTGQIGDPLCVVAPKGLCKSVSLRERSTLPRSNHQGCSTRVAPQGPEYPHASRPIEIHYLHSIVLYRAS